MEGDKGTRILSGGPSEGDPKEVIDIDPRGFPPGNRDRELSGLPIETYDVV